MRSARFLLFLVLPALAGCVTSSFARYSCRSKQSEAKSTLRQLFILETSYRSDKGSFSANPQELGFEPPEPSRYTYALPAVSADRFRAEARGNGEMAGDFWTIDERGIPEMLTDVCTQ
jgi:hypothetical protein